MDDSSTAPIVKLSVSDLTLGYPVLMNKRGGQQKDTDHRLFPSECKERGINYGAQLNLTLTCQVDESTAYSTRLNMGQVPVMVGSQRCHLKGLSPKQMVKRHEDETELGGYFICNGNEKMFRLLQVPRRNHIMSIERPSFQKRGSEYTTKAVVCRSVNPLFQGGSTITLHYLRDGTARVRLTIRKSEYFIPVGILLKALRWRSSMTTDKELYTRILGADGSKFARDRVELILAQTSRSGLYTSEQCVAHLGSHFRPVLGLLPLHSSDLEAGKYLLNHFILVHFSETSSKAAKKTSSQGEKKFDFLVEMVKKLLSFVEGVTGVDDPDALQNHELLTVGQVYGMMIKERLENLLLGVRNQIDRDLVNNPSDLIKRFNISASAVLYLKKTIVKQGDLGRKLFYFMTTGNLVSESGLDLMQVSGYTIVAEKLNRYRYLAHFRAVHRGQFFTEMKTTEVRRLLPESWGFLCPVHTPDGSPCGLLNHLASLCNIVNFEQPGMSTILPTLSNLLMEWGMVGSVCASGLVTPPGYVPVCIDGQVLGHVSPSLLDILANKLRALKAVSMMRHLKQLKATKSTWEGGEIFPTARILELSRLDDTLVPGSLPVSLEVVVIPQSYHAGSSSGLFPLPGREPFG